MKENETAAEAQTKNQAPQAAREEDDLSRLGRGNPTFWFSLIAIPVIIGLLSLVVPNNFLMPDRHNPAAREKTERILFEEGSTVENRKKYFHMRMEMNAERLGVDLDDYRMIEPVFTVTDKQVKTCDFRDLAGLRPDTQDVLRVLKNAGRPYVFYTKDIGLNHKPVPGHIYAEIGPDYKLTRVFCTTDGE